MAHQCSPPKRLMMLLLFISFSIPSSSAASSEKVDQTLLPQPADTEIKCGTCPCVNPCGQQLPLPPPPPPPPTKNPPTQNCNPVLPPPPPRFIYVTGVPGSLYTTDADAWEFYSAAKSSFAPGMLLLGACGLIELMMVFG